ncbi:hypothetical protein ONS95_008443 [Cadophora gregata]|uniref:uncharacterized protein n=1 Tax=Cadophora gregata TaxID=51156 RepID=UPI0026DCFA3A|nr:uncharacterized protein ONS95_008443 [Cadophora gregata]KAK0100494.1 hypothetical protein ONS96_007769 [Cadophora gregata f. sp. sojae]KAK0126864.1 hypothetical protein ONS95_008443 [Cadophora gregata]
MAGTPTTNPSIHEMTDSELARLNETALRAKKTKIDNALDELQKKFLETKTLIDRELANSNTATPTSVTVVGNTIRGIDLTKAWTRHETEMLKPKKQRELDHWNHVRKMRSESFFNDPITICWVMKTAPALELTVQQMRALKEHFDTEEFGRTEN